jgi:uncharacterized protein (TIGR01777 family)
MIKKSMDTVLITGASGLIGSHLAPILQGKYNVHLLTRNPAADNEYAWDPVKKEIDENALTDVDYIVHLSGSKLNDGTALTPERQKLVYDTRIGAADFLREKLKARNQQIKSFISASAIGYYGFTDNTLEIDENGDRGGGFSAQLCVDWEAAADRFKTEKVATNVAKIRVSLVLGNGGGVFPLYENNVRQYPAIAQREDRASMPWNHVEDMAGIFAFAVTNNLDGVFNSVAPQPASAQDLFKAIANQIAGTNYTITPFKGQHLVSHKIVEAGYHFRHPNIAEAVQHIMAASK